MEIFRVRLVVGMNGPWQDPRVWLNEVAKVERAYAQASGVAYALVTWGAEELIDCRDDRLRERFNGPVLRGAFAFYSHQPVDVTLAVGVDGDDPLYARDEKAPIGTLENAFGKEWAEVLRPYCCSALAPDQRALLGHSWEERGGYSRGRGKPEKIKRYCRWCVLETSRDARYQGEAAGR